MSHFTKIQTQINDIGILKKTLEKFGYSYQEDANHVGGLKVKGYNGKVHSADIAVATDNPNYAIGFEKQADETYAIVADWYGIQSIQGKAVTMDSFRQATIQHYGFEKAKASLPPHLRIVEEQGGLQQEVLTLKIKRIY